MFCFITSLRSATVADDWQRVCELFERTALSVFNQTSPEFRFIVVCHELPVLSRSFDARLEFLSVNHAAPDRIHEKMIDDKVQKLLAAMRRVRELGADFVMPVDADDLVSRKIVAHALSNPDTDGWYVERGYRYEYGRSWIEGMTGFFQVCGTCNIVSRRLFAFPCAPEREAIADDSLIVQGHNQAVEAFSKMGVRLKPLPFAGAVYTVRNGENSSRLESIGQNGASRKALRSFAGDSKRAALKWMKRRPCTPTVRREFALNCSAL